jgi:heme-degrading monooxygenase HmoA
MSVVKINAIEVGPDRGPELEKRFEARAKEVEQMPGFEGFELLRPVEGESRYFVYTRWEAAADKSLQPVAHDSALLSFEVVLKA